MPGKYDKHFLTDVGGVPPAFAREVISGPQIGFDGAKQIPGAKANFGGELFTRPFLLEKEAHTHDADEYLMFLGGQFPDLIGSFDAEIDFWMGEEQEKHVITRPTIIYIPAGLLHTPLDIRVVNKPVFFFVILMMPYFAKWMGGREYIVDAPPGIKPRKAAK